MHPGASSRFDSYGCHGGRQESFRAGADRYGLRKVMIATVESGRLLQSVGFFTTCSGGLFACSSASAASFFRVLSSSIFFSRKVSQAELRQFGKNDRARQNGNARTYSEVTNEICCDWGCVEGLVSAKLLDGWNTPTGWRISEESIAMFKKKYVSLLSMARETGRISRTLMRHCARKHIPTLMVKHPSKETKHAFVCLYKRAKCGVVLSASPLVEQTTVSNPAVQPAY
jgi:hypothetical protein